MMGENLVVFYKQRLRKEHKQAFFAAFFIGLLVIFINSPTICRTMIRCFIIFLIRILSSPGGGRCPRHAR